MLDPTLLRTDLDAVVAGLARRGFAFDREGFARVDGARRRVIQEAEALKAERNRVSEEVAARKRAKQDAADLIEAQKTVGERLKALEAAEREAERAFRDVLATIPNVPHASVPEGRDEHGNVEVKRWGSLPQIEQPKDHVELGTKLGILDLDRAAKLSGARFAVLKGLGAKLERALAAFMLDLQTQAGWGEVLPPYLVNPESMFGTGQLPKFEADLFKVPTLRPDLLWKVSTDDPLLFEIDSIFGPRFSVQVIANNKSFGTTKWTQESDSFTVTDDLHQMIAEAYKSVGMLESTSVEKAIQGLFRAIHECMERGRSSSLYLIPTAEVPVTNLYRDEILAAETLPLRHCAFTPCFRSEAGSYGKDTKGIIRQHQFHKVELVSFATPEQAEAELEHLTGCAEAVLEALGLPYRRVLLCTGDMGFSSQKTYDLEVWLPSQNTYREISSCSWFGDFQARRAAIRSKGTEPKAKPQLVHTLNGSGLAVGRTWVAVLENGQQPDGSVRIPAALVPYLGTDLLR